MVVVTIPLAFPRKCNQLGRMYCCTETKRIFASAFPTLNHHIMSLNKDYLNGTRISYGGTLVFRLTDLKFQWRSNSTWWYLR
jgi:hypothetical protein